MTPLPASTIALIVPTRGRLPAVEAFLDKWAGSTDGRSTVWLACDLDDPATVGVSRVVVAGYRDLPVRLVTGHRQTMAGWTNALYPATGARVVCSLGDDHRVTGPWESQVLAAVDDLGGVGVVYGDDGIQHEGLPTCAFVTANIVDALGYMIPPGIEHLYADNFWLELGKRAGCLRYVPELSTPHLHPILEAKGSPWDDLYRENNSEAAFARDGAAFDRWLAEQADADVAKVAAIPRTP